MANIYILILLSVRIFKIFKYFYEVKLGAFCVRQYSITFIFKNWSILPACMCVYCVHTGAMEVRRGCQITLEHIRSH